MVRRAGRAHTSTLVSHSKSLIVPFFRKCSFFPVKFVFFPVIYFPTSVLILQECFSLCLTELAYAKKQLGDNKVLVTGGVRSVVYISK